MPVLTRSARGSANQLLHNVLDEPQLMAAIRELPASTLVRLFHHVGLEEAGELIALTSTQQLGDVFDVELWQAAEPGRDETFRPERFALYLHLLYEAGESFVVERLQALPRELLTLAVHKLLLVIDIDALTVRFSSAGRFFDEGMDRVARAIDDAQFEEWEELRLIARDPSAFEDVWNALLALDRDNHELVRYVLERCCDMDGELIEESGLYAVLNEEDLLENDLASDRSDRRAAQGFVAPADARAFLELARSASVDNPPDGRDPIARAYFRELAPEPAKTAGARALPAARAAAPDVGRLLQVLRDANVFDDEPLRASAELTAPGAGALPKSAGQATLAKRTRASGGARLAGAAVSDERHMPLMASSMRLLGETDLALHGQRSEELGFLANVLMAGSQHDGRAYRPVEAIECALCVCSVGIERELRLRAKRKPLPPSAARGARLLRELSADRLFRAGMRALHVDVVQTARAAVGRLLGADVVVHSGGAAVLAAQLGLEAQSALALSALAESEPWLTGELASHEQRFLASEQAIESARRFLTSCER